MRSPRSVVVRTLVVAAVVVGTLVATSPPASAAASCPTIDPATHHIVDGTSQLDVNWSGCDLRGLYEQLYLVGADLSGADLTGAILSYSQFVDVDMSNVTFRDVSANVSQVQGANLSGADLTGATFLQSTWSGLTGVPAAMPTAGAAIRGGYLVANDVWLRGLSLPGIDLSHLDVAGLDLVSADVHGADFTGSRLPGLALGGANAEGIQAAGVDLSGGITTTGASFVDSHFEGANLSGIHGGQTNWDAIHAEGADLSGGSFSLSSFTNADLRSTNLTNANLGDSHVDGADFTGATWSHTMCPDDSWLERHVGASCWAAVDYTAPVTTMTAPSAVYSIDAPMKFAWSTVETGVGLQLGRYQWSRAVAGVASTPVWSAEMPVTVTATSGSLTGAPGYRYCFRTRFEDGWNAGSYPAARCTTLPYDDVSLSVSKGWARSRTAGGFLGRSYTASTTVNSYALLNKTFTARQVGVVATRCPTCGAVAVYVGATKVGVVNLASSVTRVRALLLLPRFSTLRKGAIKIVVTTSRKLVRLDGVIVSAS